MLLPAALVLSDDTSVQDVPSHVSTLLLYGGIKPPTPMAAVAVPVPESISLDVFKSLKLLHYFLEVVFLE